MFNELALVSVTPFSGTDTPDKNGSFPVMLQCIAGKIPNRNVLSGTVAQRAGLEVGKTYLVSIREQGLDKLFGNDYNITKVKEVDTAEDIIKARKELGDPGVFIIERPEGFEDKYQRKSTAIEGLRTARIKSGDYIPSTASTAMNHKTAKEVLKGSSQQSLRDIPTISIPGEHTPVSDR